MRKYLSLFLLISLKAFASQSSQEIIIDPSSSNSSSSYISNKEIKKTIKQTTSSRGEKGSSRNSKDSKGSSHSQNPFHSVNQFQSPDQNVFAATTSPRQSSLSSEQQQVFRPTTTVVNNPLLFPNAVQASFPPQQSVFPSLNNPHSSSNSLNRAMIATIQPQELNEIKQAIDLLNMRFGIIERQQNDLANLTQNFENTRMRDFSTIENIVNAINNRTATGYEQLNSQLTALRNVNLSFQRQLGSLRTDMNHLATAASRPIAVSVPTAITPKQTLSKISKFKLK